MAESYDAADPGKASMLALREDWMDGDGGTQSRVVVGYGALIDFLVKDCRIHGVVLHQGAKVVVLESENGGAAVRCTDCSSHLCDAAILTVSLPLLNDITFPPASCGRTRQPR